jgi:predicted metal-binding protein
MPEPQSTPVIVTVCTTCRQEGTARDEADGLSLLEDVRSAAAGVAGLLVRPTQCLSVCKRVCCVSISGVGRYTFLFGDLLPARDAAAVVAMAKACRDAPHGFVPWKDRPEALRKGIIARVPPPNWSPADGASPG